MKKLHTRKPWQRTHMRKVYRDLIDLARLTDEQRLIDLYVETLPTQLRAVLALLTFIGACQKDA